MLLKPGKITLGIERFFCPNCDYPVMLEIDSDVPERDYLTCPACGYRGILEFGSIRKKYGLPERGLSTEETRDYSRHLQRETAHIGG